MNKYEYKKIVDNYIYSFKTLWDYNKLEDLIINYCDEFDCSFDQTIRELDLLVVEPMFEDLKKKILRRKKIKRLI